MNNVLNLMKYEEKLARLLGLTIKLGDEENIYELFGPNGIVGTIKKHEELINGKKEIFYTTKIKTDKFYFYKKRNINDKNFNYTFYVDLDKENRIFIDMELGIDPFVIIYSKEQDIIALKIDARKLDLVYPTKLSNAKVLETLKISLDTRSDLKRMVGSSYKYEALVTDENNDVKKYQQTIYANKEGDLLVIQNTNNFNSLSKVNGTIREALEKDENAKDLFSRFRAYVNNLFPFQKDFLGTFLEERQNYLDAFSRLYKDLVKEHYYKIKEINNRTLIGVKLSPPPEDLKSYATIIYDLKDKYEFGYVEGLGDYAGSYEWNNRYVYRLSHNSEIEAIFDILNREEIKDKENYQKLYKEFKKSKMKKIGL